MEKSPGLFERMEELEERSLPLLQLARGQVRWVLGDPANPSRKGSGMEHELKIRPQLTPAVERGNGLGRP